MFTLVPARIVAVIGLTRFGRLPPQPRWQKPSGTDATKGIQQQEHYRNAPI